MAASCGADSGVKLTAEAKYCAIPNTLELELKICVDVLSDIVNMIGKFVPPVEVLMNNLFNVYAGCLRLAYAKYDIANARMQTWMGYKRFFDGTLFSLSIDANCK